MVFKRASKQVQLVYYIPSLKIDQVKLSYVIIIDEIRKLLASTAKLLKGFCGSFKGMEKIWREKNEKQLRKNYLTQIADK